MVADSRFKVMQPLRAALATVLYPAQWLALRPVLAYRDVSQYFSTLSAAQNTQDEIVRKHNLQSQRANQVDQLTLENSRLRKLVGLRDRLQSPGMVSEVTLITDRDHAIPVLNTRTGARGVAYGDVSLHADAMELRFMAANADVTAGDLLTTSGVDGVYPAGLPVARVEKVERRTDAVFARIYCVPLSLVSGAAHVLVLDPTTSQVAPRPVPDPPAIVSRRGAAK
jgi:rod shape-determining protein MreC